MNQTLLLIKPNVVKNNMVGEVIASLEKNGLVIENMKMEKLTTRRAKEFYSVHKGKPFFDKLVEFMTSGSIVEIILEVSEENRNRNIVEYVRKVIGNTDPEKAGHGTIRSRFGDSVTENAVHASDSAENAVWEIEFMFGSG